MDEIPFSTNFADLRHEFWRWIKIEWRLYFTMAIVTVGLSLIWSIHKDKPEWFARSGSVLSLCGGIITFRRFLRGKDNVNFSISGYADKRPFKRWHMYNSRMEAEAEDSKAMVIGIWFIIFGTLLWGYGDVILNYFL